MSSRDDHTWLGLSEGPLPLTSVSEWAVRPDCGALVVFTGTVRDHAGDREQAHPELAHEQREHGDDQAEPQRHDHGDDQGDDEGRLSEKTRAANPGGHRCRCRSVGIE